MRFSFAAVLRRMSAFTFTAESKKLVHIEWCLLSNSFFDPFNRDFRCCAKRSVGRLAIFREDRESLPRNLTQEPQHACAVTESLNVCSRFADLLSDTSARRNLPPGVSRLNFLLFLPKCPEVVGVNFGYRLSRLTSE